MRCYSKSKAREAWRLKASKSIFSLKRYLNIQRLNIWSPAGIVPSLQSSVENLTKSFWSSYFVLVVLAAAYARAGIVFGGQFRTVAESALSSPRPKAWRVLAQQEQLLNQNCFGHSAQAPTLRNSVKSVCAVLPSAVVRNAEEISNSWSWRRFSALLLYASSQKSYSECPSLAWFIAQLWSTERLLKQFCFHLLLRLS